MGICVMQHVRLCCAEITEHFLTYYSCSRLKHTHKSVKRNMPAAGTKRKADTEKNAKNKRKDESSAPKKKSYPKNITEESLQETSDDIVFTAKPPTRKSNGDIIFEDAKEFRPNMTPSEVLQAGSFGGTYFRPIKSSITGKSYSGVWKELPKEWLEGLNIGQQVSSSTYRESVNTYGVKCGGSLEMW